MFLFSIFSWIVMFFNGSLYTDAFSFSNSSFQYPVIENKVDFWVTNGNRSIYLQKQNGILTFQSGKSESANIQVDDSHTYQTIDGFGYTLTGGSAQSINKLNSQKRKELLQELFGNNENSIKISYLRISIGASDLNATPFTYNDLPAGQTDVSLCQFSLLPDKDDLIPMLKEIIAINPHIKILATPWSPPTWMKNNNSFIGGSLKPEYYGVYAAYFVKYIQKMKDEGISISAITPQNEPLHPGNNPSMFMSAEQQASFIKEYLGPAFVTANLSTKIIIYDHNCDRPDYPMSILKDPIANAFIDGSAFHLYAGDISALTTVHDAYPNKNLYFTEQYTGTSGTFVGDLKWHMKNVIIGSMRNWSKVALEWNLANDANFGPHTLGGCTTCKGAITINSSDSYERNVSYYIIAHVSKFVPPGSVRIASTQKGNINSIAFKTPAGKKVLILENDGDANEKCTIEFNQKLFSTSLDGGSVATFIWN
ncbi:glycoside hydrolase family 30 protein [Flavobacterium ammonificans]|nr:glycoside hydrolase family 30 beta sandwich domain-containing protein [Flavobacterium ammonificans]